MRQSKQNLGSIKKYIKHLKILFTQFTSINGNFLKIFYVEMYMICSIYICKVTWEKLVKFKNEYEN